MEAQGSGEVLTLLQASADAFLRSPKLNPQDLKYLPKHLKDYARKVILQRGEISKSILEALLHDNVKSLSFTEIIKRGITGTHLRETPWNGL